MKEIKTEYHGHELCLYKNFKCPICKNPMTLAKPLKLELKIVLEDGTTDRMYH